MKELTDDTYLRCKFNNNTNFLLLCNKIKSVDIKNFTIPTKHYRSDEQSNIHSDTGLCMYRGHPDKIRLQGEGGGGVN